MEADDAKEVAAVATIDEVHSLPPCIIHARLPINRDQGMGGEERTRAAERKAESRSVKETRPDRRTQGSESFDLAVHNSLMVAQAGGVNSNEHRSMRTFHHHPTPNPISTLPQTSSTSENKRRHLTKDKSHRKYCHLMSTSVPCQQTPFPVCECWIERSC